MKVLDQEVIEYRRVAAKMVHSLLRRWKAPLPKDKITDIADMAIAVTLSKFDPAKGKFETYLFYAILAELRVEITKSFKHKDLTFTDTPLLSAVTQDFESVYLMRDALSVCYQRLPAKRKKHLVDVLLDKKRRFTCTRGKWFSRFLGELNHELGR